MKKTHQPPSIHLLKAPPTILLEGDLEGCVPTKMDFKIANMYDSSYIRSNDGSHLNGSIIDDKIW